jgi:tetratricopeptide (TPR) repeat protein
MVGTSSNPNFLGAFLSITAVFTLGVALDQSLRKTISRNIFLVMFATQVVALMLIHQPGVTLSLCFGMILLFTRAWEIRPGRILRISPLVSGVIMTVVLVFFYGLVYYSTANYPWDSLQRPPSAYFPIVTRLILWQMGFSVFLSHPLAGLGAGSLPYLLPEQRPPLGSALGIKIFNDDPHSGVLTFLAETGFFGLTAVCSILAVAYGCFVWFRFKNNREDILESEEAVTVQPEVIQPAWSACMVSAILLAVMFGLDFLPLHLALYSLPVVITVFGLHNSLISSNAHAGRSFLPNLPKATMVAMLTFTFNCLYNTSISILPLSAFCVLLFSLHFSACQRDIVWKKKFSFVSLAFICFPAMYVFAAYSFQIAHHHEQIQLFLGESHIRQQNYPESQKAFEAAIQRNPQSLKAHYGLALSLEKQSRLDESQEIFKRLDSMVPNAFNSNYELARILLERRQILEAHRYALKSLNWDQAPSAYELLGHILALEGKYSEAEKILVEGLMLVPENTFEMQAADRIRLNLAAIMANRGNYEACADYLNTIKTSVSEELDALYLNGMLLSRKRQHREALEIFEKALELSPQNPKFLNAVGYTLSELEIDQERAQNLLESAYQIVKRNNPPSLSDLLMITHSLGKLYWKTGKTAEAAQLLEIAYEQCPEEWASLKKERLEDLQMFKKQHEQTTAIQEPQVPELASGSFVEPATQASATIEP